MQSCYFREIYSETLRMTTSETEVSLNTLPLTGCDLSGLGILVLPVILIGLKGHPNTENFLKFQTKVLLHLKTISGSSSHPFCIPQLQAERPGKTRIHSTVLSVTLGTCVCRNCFLPLKAHDADLSLPTQRYCS